MVTEHFGDPDGEYDLDALDRHMWKLLDALAACGVVVTVPPDWKRST